MQSLALRGKLKQEGQLYPSQHLGNTTGVLTATAPLECSSPPSRRGLKEMLSRVGVHTVPPSPVERSLVGGFGSFPSCHPSPESDF